MTGGGYWFWATVCEHDPSEFLLLGVGRDGAWAQLSLLPFLLITRCLDVGKIAGGCLLGLARVMDDAQTSFGALVLVPA